MSKNRKGFNLRRDRLTHEVVTCQFDILATFHCCVEADGSLDKYVINLLRYVVETDPEMARPFSQALDELIYLIQDTRGDISKVEEVIVAKGKILCSSDIEPDGDTMKINISKN